LDPAFTSDGYETGSDDMAGEAAPQAAGSGSETADEQALAALRWGWGEAYRIGWDATRGWWAARCDGKGGDITADDSGELWQAIVDDYTLLPVPRGRPAPARGEP
jgi:hypothetical protein